MSQFDFEKIMMMIKWRVINYELISFLMEKFILRFFKGTPSYRYWIKGFLHLQYLKDIFWGKYYSRLQNIEHFSLKIWHCSKSFTLDYKPLSKFCCFVCWDTYLTKFYQFWVLVIWFTFWIIPRNSCKSCLFKFAIHHSLLCHSVTQTLCA